MNNNRIFFVAVIILIAILLVALFMTSGGAAKYNRADKTPSTKSLPPIVQAYAERLNSPIDADKALELLKHGNQRFVNMKRLSDPGVGIESRKFLANDQWPYAAVISCCDSRIPPEYLFDTGLGDLAVIRVAGPVASDAVFGSIEQVLSDGRCHLVVVMGHLQCPVMRNAIKAVENPAARRSFWANAIITRLVPSILQAKADAESTKVEATAERLNVLRTIAQLRSGSELVKLQEAEGKLKIVGAITDPATGKVNFMQLKSDD